MQSSNYLALQHQDPNHEYIVCVNWCIGTTCNYSCSYCPTELHDGSHPWVEYDDVVRFCDTVYRHYQTVDKNLRMFYEFTGGEVTLNKDFPKIIRYLKDQGQQVGLISNGSRTLRYWNEQKEFIDHICLSYHSEFADGDHFIAVVKELSDSVDVHVNIMVKPGAMFEQSVNFALKVREASANCTIDIQTLLVDFTDKQYPYTDDERERMTALKAELKETENKDRPRVSYRGTMMKTFPGGSTTPIGASTLVHNGENNWYGWDCYAGVEQMVVDPSGDIWRGWCKQGGKMGNVRNGAFHFPTRPVLCGAEYCHCNFDIMSTKVRRLVQ